MHKRRNILDFLILSFSFKKYKRNKNLKLDLTEKECLKKYKINEIQPLYAHKQAHNIQHTTNTLYKNTSFDIEKYDGGVVSVSVG